MQFEVDGRKVYAHTGGKRFDPKGDVVVLLHGAAMDHVAWTLQTRYLAHHGKAVLTPDLPGCGASEGPVLGSIEDYAAWLHRALEALGVESAALAGHSMGALIALEAAGQRPERITALCLVGLGYPMGVNDNFLNMARDDTPSAVAMMNDWAHGRRAHMGGFLAPGLWLVGMDTRVIERAAPGVMYQCLALCAAYANGEAAAAKLRCPTRLVLGGNDMMTPLKAGLKTAAMIDGADVVTLQDCGHMIMVESPRELMRALQALLDRAVA